jgi:hypothetical protein
MQIQTPLQKIFNSKSPIWALLLLICQAPNPRAKAKVIKPNVYPPKNYCSKATL